MTSRDHEIEQLRMAIGRTDERIVAHELTLRQLHDKRSRQLAELRFQEHLRGRQRQEQKEAA